LDPLLTLSGTGLARKIRDREITSGEVVDAHIRRVQEVNPRINAVVRDRFEAAREEASAADRRTRQGAPEDLPPFHGVPCTIKESFAFAGMPWTSGLKARVGVAPDRDCVTVTRMRASGAIPLGVTNISELCMWMESNNTVYGRTRNPYDARRIVGGSSGGEGAIVGAGGSPFGLGADVGGSIRMPAFFNGVFGHKSTGGLVPGTGQYPESHGEVRRYNTTGPLCRRAEDLMPLLRLLAGPDGVDPGVRALPLGDPASVDLSSLTVHDVEDNGVFGVSADLKEAQRRVAAWFVSRGATVVRTRFESFKHTFDVWGSMLSEGGGPSFAELLGNGTKVRAGRELMKWSVGLSDHTLPALVLAMLEKALATPERNRRFVEMGLAIQAEVTERVGPRGIVLFPSHAYPAPRHGAPLLPPPFRWTYTAIWNVLQFPVTQVPLGLNARGLPLGVQVVAIEGNDHVTIAAALALEQAFGGWVPPPISSLGRASR
jgi:fatty acid amide hydrolase 2